MELNRTLASCMLSDLQESTLRGFSYGLERTDVASQLDVSPEQVDQIVAEVYSKLFELNRVVRSRASY